MHDDKTHGHHHHPKSNRLPVWLLALGAVGLLVLIVGVIVGVGVLGAEFMAKPPGEAPVTAPTDASRPVLPIGR